MFWSIVGVIIGVGIIFIGASCILSGTISEQERQRQHQEREEM